MFKNEVLTSAVKSDTLLIGFVVLYIFFFNLGVGPVKFTLLRYIILTSKLNISLMLELLVKCLSQKNRRLLQDCACFFTGLSRSVSPSSSSISWTFLVLPQYSSPCQFPSSAASFSPGFWCQKQERKRRRRSKNSQVCDNQYKYIINVFISRANIF